jgi:hypothetical protein
MPGGIWDTKYFVMKGQLMKEGRLIREFPLKYEGQPSSFSAPLEISEPGPYELTVSAFEPRNGNSGSAAASFVVK